MFLAKFFNNVSALQILGAPQTDQKTGGIDPNAANFDTHHVAPTIQPDTKTLPEPSPASTSSEPIISTQEAWKLFTNQFAEADKAMVEGWKEDMDGLLIFVRT